MTPFVHKETVEIYLLLFRYGLGKESGFSCHILYIWKTRAETNCFIARSKQRILGLVCNV